MRNRFHLLTILAMILSLAFASCGPDQKFIELQKKVDQLQQEKTTLTDQLKSCDRKVEMLALDKLTIQNENERVQTDLKLVNHLAQNTIFNQAKRLQPLQDKVKLQREVMAKLKSSIANALMNFKTEELSVHTIDGNVYVRLQDELLFKSGSDLIDINGIVALKALALVLNTTSDITVMIEGHTDDIPIKTDQYKDNWDLSTARATTILRILTNDYNFDPTRITASGKGKFHPIKSNETAEGRAANRRTEVILSPNLNELFMLLDQED